MSNSKLLAKTHQVPKTLPPINDQTSVGLGNGTDQDRRHVSILFFGVIVIGLLFTTAALVEYGTWQAVFTALLWALACFTFSALAGFLFGIPKVMQSGTEGVKDGADGESQADRTYRSLVNTNLGEISDWLTKIIVGLGLINLNQVPDQLRSAARILASGLRVGVPSPDHEAYSIALIVAFACLGFLFGYLSTRLYLAAAFKRADNDGLNVQRDSDSGALDTLKLAFGSLNAKVNQLIENISGGVRSAEVQEEDVNSDVHAENDNKSSIDTSNVDAVKEAEKNDAGSGLIQKESTTGSNVFGDDIKAVESAGSKEGRNQLWKNFVQFAEGVAYKETLKQLAGEYNDFQSLNYAERVSFRDAVLDRMAALITTYPDARAWVARQAQTTQDVAMIAAYATVIISEPKQGDAENLFSMNLFFPYKHARYRVAAAIGRLFDQRLASEAHLDATRAVLSAYFTHHTDDLLKHRIVQTLAQIQTSTGKVLKLGTA